MAVRPSIPFARWQRPLLGCQLDPAHPLASGLVLCYVFNESAGVLFNDLSAKGNDGSRVGAATWFGPALKTSANGDGVSIPNRPLDFGTAPFTVACCMAAKSANAPSNATMVGNNDFGVLNGWNLQSNGSGKCSVNLNNNYTTFLTSSHTVFDGTPHTCVWTRLGATYTLYTDGIFDNRSASGNSGSLNASGHQQVATQFGAGANNRTIFGLWYFAMAWSRVLDQGEIDSLTSEPYGLLLPPEPRRSWLLPAAAGGTPVLRGGVLHFQLVGRGAA